MLRLFEAAEACLKNGINMVSDETNFVVAVELTLSEKTCSDMEENFTERLWENIKVPVLQTLNSCWSFEWVSIYHFQDKFYHCLVGNVLNKFIAWVVIAFSVLLKF